MGKLPSMVEKRSAPSRRGVLLERLGGQPGPYAVAWVVLAALWLPFRLLLDKGDPIADIVAASGMGGALWALIPVAIEWGQRHSRNRGSAPTKQGSAEARRGALLGLAVGAPFSLGFLILSLSTGRSWGYPVFFGLLLLIIVAVALRNLREQSPRGAG
jgi:peptidoglycan/LPS O-acetylase OafA/YrhL